jgi:hypothetical protein
MARAWPLIVPVLHTPGSAFSDSSNLAGAVFRARAPFRHQLAQRADKLRGER